MRELPKKRLLEAFERVRIMLVEGYDATKIEAWLERQYGIRPLVPCPGEAHRNPHIDHCHQCAPRWGWIEAPASTPESAK